jgi:hypothetical protein
MHETTSSLDSPVETARRFRFFSAYEFGEQVLTGIGMAVFQRSAASGALVLLAFLLD